MDKIKLNRKQFDMLLYHIAKAREIDSDAEPLMCEECEETYIDPFPLSVEDMDKRLNDYSDILNQKVKVLGAEYTVVPKKNLMKYNIDVDLYFTPNNSEVKPYTNKTNISIDVTFNEDIDIVQYNNKTQNY